jgi:DNA-binding CsgD family transcriptional regulator
MNLQTKNRVLDLLLEGIPADEVADELGVDESEVLRLRRYMEEPL